MSKNTASIKDIAEAAGVSVSTVSRVINGKSYVNEATRQKVLAMADKINYQPNFLAKSLKMGRTLTFSTSIFAPKPSGMLLGMFS